MTWAYWGNALPLETEKVMQANRDKVMQKEPERYLAHAIGRKPSGSLHPDDARAMTYAGRGLLLRFKDFC